MNLQAIYKPVVYADRGQQIPFKMRTLYDDFYSRVWHLCNRAFHKYCDPLFRTEYYLDWIKSETSVIWYTLAAG